MRGASFGSKNPNRTVDDELEGIDCDRVLAQIDVTYSNSMIDAFWRSLKHAWLCLHGLETESELRRLTAFYVKAHKDKKVRNLSFHCARHTFASWPLEGGRSIVWVRHRLGHGSPEITLRVYSHFMPSPDDELDFLGNVTPIHRQSVA
jgi:integrase